MEDVPVKIKSATGTIFKLLLKIAVTVACFWYISKKIDFSAARDAFLKAGWTFILLAVLFLMVSKLLASFRLNIYFRNINIHLSQWKNIKLYLLGMFYNLFLPGSISGDAYKIVLLKRKYEVPYKKIAAAVLLDRFSGLVALGLILSIFGAWVLDNRWYDAVLIAGAVLSIAVLYFVIRFFLEDFLPGFWPTFLWGIAVQFMQVVCVYCLLNALDLPVHQPEWIFIFLASAIISIIPLSLGGGLGTREVVFVEGARYFGLDPQMAVIISLLFYLCTVISSIGGLVFVFLDPLRETGRQTG